VRSARASGVLLEEVPFSTSAARSSQYDRLPLRMEPLGRLRCAPALPTRWRLQHRRRTCTQTAVRQQRQQSQQRAQRILFFLAGTLGCAISARKGPCSDTAHLNASTATALPGDVSSRSRPPRRRHAPPLQIRDRYRAANAYACSRMSYGLFVAVATRSVRCGNPTIHCLNRGMSVRRTTMLLPCGNVGLHATPVSARNYCKLRCYARFIGAHDFCIHPRTCPLKHSISHWGR
jgi:hypothetical protein